MDAKLLAVCVSLAISFLLAHRILSLMRQGESERKSIRKQERLIAELKASLEDAKALKGVLPICASCKKIRDENGDWNQVEEYIRGHSEADFSHGLCPECYGKALSDGSDILLPQGDHSPVANYSGGATTGAGNLRTDNES